MDPRLPIRSIDYTVIVARQMSAMREFYGTTLGFALHRELSPRWVEYRVGSNILALTERGGRITDPSPPVGVVSVQLAFRVAPTRLGEQLADGGWNCEAERGSVRSSFHTTICVLEGLLAYEKARGATPAVTGARARAQEYLLQRRMLRRLSSGEGIRPPVGAVHVSDPVALRRAEGPGLPAPRRRHARWASGRGGRAGGGTTAAGWALAAR